VTQSSCSGGAISKIIFRARSAQSRAMPVASAHNPRALRRGARYVWGRRPAVRSSSNLWPISSCQSMPSELCGAESPPLHAIDLESPDASFLCACYFPQHLVLERSARKSDRPSLLQHPGGEIDGQTSKAVASSKVLMVGSRSNGWCSECGRNCHGNRRSHTPIRSGRAP
jgi:hypothetical protein